MVVLDRISGLYWQRSLGAAVEFPAAVTACQANAEKLPGTGWRLPTAGELRQLASRHAVVQLTVAFGTPGEAPRWTTTPGWFYWYWVEPPMWTNQLANWTFELFLPKATGLNFKEGGATGSHFQCVR